MHLPIIIGAYKTSNNTRGLQICKYLIDTAALLEQRNKCIPKYTCP